MNILSNRPNYPPKINIKPDLSEEERICESLLLTKWWKLMQIGTDKKVFKIKKSSLYIQGKLYGRVQNSSFAPWINLQCSQIFMDSDSSSTSHLSSVNSEAPTSNSDTSPHFNSQSNPNATSQSNPQEWLDYNDNVSAFFVMLKVFVINCITSKATFMLPFSM